MGCADRTVLLAAAGCAQPVETIDDMASFDPSQDQMAIADSYRAEAMVLREKAAAHAESIVRYERLFGPQSDWVSGARQLSQYYAEVAQELERRAEAHERSLERHSSDGRDRRETAAIQSKAGNKQRRTYEARNSFSRDRADGFRFCW